MPERFTETMRAASEAGWSHAVQHRFVNELFAGAVPDAVMARYLVQDHRFLDSFLVLLGAALASADTFAARLRFGRFIGMVSAEENTYFLRAFEALGVTETRRAADPDTQPTIGFKAIMRRPSSDAEAVGSLAPFRHSHPDYPGVSYPIVPGRGGRALSDRGSAMRSGHFARIFGSLALIASTSAVGASRSFPCVSAKVA